MSENKTRSYLNLFLSALCLFILLVLSFETRLHSLATDRLWPDEALYAWCSYQIALNPAIIFSEEIIKYHPPLIHLINASMQTFLPPLIAERFVSLIFNLTGIGLIFILGHQLRNIYLALFSGFLLSFLQIYYVQTNMILLDVPLTIAFMLFMLLWFNSFNKLTPIKSLLLGLSAAMIILTKSSGILIIPVIIAFLIYHHSRKSKKEEGTRIFYSIILGLPLMALFLISLNLKIQTGFWIPNTEAMVQAFNPQPFWSYISDLNVYFPIYLIPLFILGIYAGLKERRPKDIYLLIWFIINLIGISITKEKDYRYALLILPQVIFLSGIGFQYVLTLFRIHNKRVVAATQLLFIIIVILLQSIAFPKTLANTLLINRTYSGLGETGQWLKANATAETKIYAGSIRAIRYTSGINFDKYGGALYQLPEDIDSFLSHLSSDDARHYLVVDQYEYTQPQWVHPLSKEKLLNLIDRGYKLRQLAPQKQNNKNTYSVFVLQWDP